MTGDRHAGDDGSGTSNDIAFGGSLNVGDWLGEDFSDGCFRQAELLDDFVCGAGGRFPSGVHDAWAGLDDSTVVEALGLVHCHQRADFRAAAGFAEDKDVGRIATERFDVVAHPFE